jgi:hypothetical protein
VLAFVELKTAVLDYGIPGISQMHMQLLFLMMFVVPLIPFLFLFLSLRDEPGAPVKPLRAEPTWVHAHGNPALLHH